MNNNTHCGAPNACSEGTRFPFLRFADHDKSLLTQNCIAWEGTKQNQLDNETKFCQNMIRGLSSWLEHLESPTIFFLKKWTRGSDDTLVSVGGPTCHWSPSLEFVATVVCSQVPSLQLPLFATRYSHMLNAHGLCCFIVCFLPVTRAK